MIVSQTPRLVSIVPPATGMKGARVGADRTARMSRQDEHFSAAHILEKPESLVHRVEEGAVHVLHRLALGKVRSAGPRRRTRLPTTRGGVVVWVSSGCQLLHAPGDRLRSDR